MSELLKQEEQYIHITKLGNMFYYKDRKMTILHREDGPAVQWNDDTKEYWVNGVETTDYCVNEN